MKEKDFTNVRKWLVENSDVTPDDLFSRLYATMENRVASRSFPEFIIFLSECAKEVAFVANPEISLAAMCAKIMATCEFK
jgi:hypothetical protein